MKILETERTILRQWDSSEAEIIFSYASNPLVGPACGWSPHKDVEESKTIIEKVLKQPGTYAIVIKETGFPVGTVTLKSANNSPYVRNEDESELGYWIGVPYWGKGIITEVCQIILAYAFDTLEKKLVWCSNFSSNLGSARVKEKIGFSYHHTDIGRFFPQLQENHDCVVGQISREQWKSAQM